MPCLFSSDFGNSDDPAGLEFGGTTRACINDNTVTYLPAKMHRMVTLRVSTPTMTDAEAPWFSVWLL